LNLRVKWLAGEGCIALFNYRVQERPVGRRTGRPLNEKHAVNWPNLVGGRRRRRRRRRSGKLFENSDENSKVQ